VSKTSAKSLDTDKPAPAPVAKKAATAVAAPAPAAKTAKTAPAKSAAKVSAAKSDEPEAHPLAEAASPAARTPAVTSAAPVPGTNRFSDRFSPPKPPARGFPEPMETVKPAVKADPKLVNAWKSKAGRDLTEPELLAMPESEYMNDKQLDFFRARLQALKDDLLSNAGETTEHLREDTSIVPDPADRATIEEEHALELRTRDRERKLLKKISQSLGRIEAGDYGYCDETGEPIGLGRLLARPTATLSLEAQQRRELKQKMFGD
jgi:DnaK suppressor protein